MVSRKISQGLAGLGWPLLEWFSRPPCGPSSSNRLLELVHVMVTGFQEQEGKCARDFEAQAWNLPKITVRHLSVKEVMRSAQIQRLRK